MRNKLLDQTRLIAAFMVILIHAPLPGVMGQAVEAVSRVAVPIFFMVSGYYALGKSVEQLLKSAKKTAILLLWSSVLYIIWGFLWSVYKGTTTTFVAQILSVHSLVETVIWNNGTLLGHLWFLLALLYCYLLYALFLRKVSSSAQLCVSAVLYIGFFAIREMLKWLGVENPVYYLRNFLFVGIPFFLLGSIIRQRKGDLLHRSTALWLILLGAGIIASLVERFGVGCCDVYVGTGIAAVALFIITQKAEFPTIKTMAILGEKYAGDIYIFHSLIIGLLNAVASVVGVLYLTVYVWVRPIIVLAISIAVAYCKQALTAHIIDRQNAGKQ